MSDTEIESIEASSDVFKEEEEEIFLKEEEVESDLDYIPDKEYDSDDSRCSSYDEDEEDEEESETDEF